MHLNPYLRAIISLIAAGLCGCNEVGSRHLSRLIGLVNDCVGDIDVCAVTTGRFCFLFDLTGWTPYGTIGPTKESDLN